MICLSAAEAPSTSPSIFSTDATCDFGSRNPPDVTPVAPSLIFPFTESFWAGFLGDPSFSRLDETGLCSFWYEQFEDEGERHGD